ncbi:phage distal tail protein [Sporomusa malonica]|uniref:Phage-related protein n=1 Tax=Sporomusa malonica TaxID=112901 RepID=A0A1W2ARK0_9FIRM|nr:phage tail domain-containing protein [Sporomusa malonica]SMC63142.1 Phage-related protein [Sporomusa malonica]
MKIVKNNKTFLLPELASVDGLGGHTIRTDDETRAYSHGRIETGDGKVDSKTIEVEVYIFGVNRLDHDQQYNSLLAAFNQKKYKLFVRDDRYMNIECMSKDTHEWFKGFQFVRSKLTVTLKAIDPFWYDTGSIIERRTITETPKTLIIDNPGNIDVSPVITITATNTCPSILITNITDENRQFQYADLQLTAGSTVKIDCQNGTVYRGTANSLNAFNGTFLKLLPGENEITYAGEDCVIDFEFTRRWL